ncbi:hypothetical protein FXF51_01680 [Nonomuraea sp. PA05]|uniref:hypothetical protein n=1 Tax=Nonomuraea sp. PA05 TaxID=2604466 RepID=UPI0011DC0424|nr:hypothetical protein [Nonomuraea sp. PA05]TYB71172.1 hypothetical protein FXF51_01680 [Nonomuraea sp. PA05]
MSIDALPEETGTPALYTPAVRNFLTQGLQQVNDAITGAERHLADLDTRREAVHAEIAEQQAAAQRHLAGLHQSREQLLALVGKNESRDPGSEESRPTLVCSCARLAVLDPVHGAVHEVNGTRLPAMEACQMPPLGFLGLPGRVAGGEGPIT